MNVSQIGRFISRRRADLGLTQAQLAQRLDVTDKAVSKWERGKSLPDVALLSRVAAELRVSVVELLSGESMNVARSSNLDEADGWEREADQATPLTLQRKAPEDLWYRLTCLAATWSTPAPASIPAYPPKWSAIGSSPGSPLPARAARWNGSPWGNGLCLPWTSPTPATGRATT